MTGIEKNHRKSNVLVIGLDGGCIRLLTHLAEQGHMPFFASVLREGVSGDLRSVFPPSTPPAWSTFLTGQNPGRHGVFEFFTYENADAPLQVVNSLSLKNETLWSLLSRAGKRIGLINVPMTYPPHPVNGVMMTGLLTPSVEQTFTYPDYLYDELKEELGKYIIGVTWKEYSPNQISDFLDALAHCTRQRQKYVNNLMQQDLWDFFMVVFSETDSLQHALWSFLDPEDPRQKDEKIAKKIFAYYRLLDEVMEQIYSTAGKETQLFFVSDHGFGPFLKWLHVNTWLNETGLLVFDEKKVRALRKMRKVRELVRKFDKYNLRKKLPVKKGYRTDILSCINWEKTKAFSVLSGEQGIRINLKGREPRGIVSQGLEYENLRDLIISRLRELRDPETGERAGDFIKKREEVYEGPYMEKAPDIVSLFGGGKWLLDVFPAKDVFEPTGWQFGTGTHRMEGLFAAMGPGIRKNETLKGAGLEDLLPTFLYALGLPVPDYIDGRILTEVYQEPVFSAGTSSDAELVRKDEIEPEGYSQEEEQLVIERLKGLGYIE